MSLDSPVLKLPITEREIFSEVHTGIRDGKSFVIHGPYQSGKTSFLWALEETLKQESDSTVVYFDISDMAGDILKQKNELEAFSHFMSFRLFGQCLS